MTSDHLKMELHPTLNYHNVSSNPLRRDATRITILTPYMSQPYKIDIPFTRPLYDACGLWHLRIKKPVYLINMDKYSPYFINSLTVYLNEETRHDFYSHQPLVVNRK